MGDEVLEGYGRHRTFTIVRPVTTASKKADALVELPDIAWKLAALVSIASPRMVREEVGVFAETTPRRKARSAGEEETSSTRVAFRPAPSRVGDPRTSTCAPAGSDARDATFR